MKSYECLFILNMAGREDSLPDTIDRLSKMIADADGKVETVQKMDKRTFSRVADNKVASGHYVNFIFECQPSNLAALEKKFAGDRDIHRTLITNKEPAPASEAAA